MVYWIYYEYKMKKKKIEENPIFLEEKKNENITKNNIKCI